MTRTMRVNNWLGSDGEYELRNPWPADCFVQGGRNGVVIARKGPGYKTAYFEAFPDTFIRGEGETLEEAEDAAWRFYQRHLACPEHDIKPHPPGKPERAYTNGAGFCQRCGMFQSNVFSGEQLGQRCQTCGVGTTFARYGPLAEFSGENAFGLITDRSPEEDKVWYCEEHAPFRREVESYFQWMRSGEDDLTFEEWRARNGDGSESV